MHLLKSANEPAHEKRVITMATSKGSDEPVHKGSLARAFAVHDINRDLQEASGKIAFL